MGLITNNTVRVVIWLSGYRVKYNGQNLTKDLAIKTIML